MEQASHIELPGKFSRLSYTTGRRPEIEIKLNGKLVYLVGPLGKEMAEGLYIALGQMLQDMEEVEACN